MIADSSPNFETSELIDSLTQQGWWVKTQFFSPELIEGLADETLTLYQNQQMTRAGIGRGQDFQQNAEIRLDFIHWLDGTTEIQQRYLAQMEALRLTLNRELFLGLFDFETHFAFYPPGAFYKKHLDSFRGQANRLVSAVTYLNADWPTDGGGELLIYTPDEQQVIAKVRPEASTLVVFLSEEIPHEVQVSHYQRSSIAGWFRVNGR